MPRSSDEEVDTRDVLLAAALATASRHGIARLSMGDVARQAGLSRQTLYRHFASKDELIAEVVAAETAALVERVAGRAAEQTDPHAALEAGLAAALRGVREHPLLDRLVTTEPETLVPLLSDMTGPVSTQVHTVVAAVLGAWAEALDAPPARVHRLVDVVTRLLISYAVAPPDESPEVVAAQLADLFLAGRPAGLASTGGT